MTGYRLKRGWARSQESGLQIGDGGWGIEVAHESSNAAIESHCYVLIAHSLLSVSCYLQVPPHYSNITNLSL